MATTSLWRVHGWLGKLVVYVENPDKTDNPEYYKKPEMTAAQTQSLADVIEYAVNTRKTTLQADNETDPVMQQFVSGVNVSPITARESMLNTKREFQKTDGVVAYHGYQSFAPGEATPEMAHEIGVKLANQLWGDKYQVLIATHLDKKHHLHNHFIINTVSHIDGKKFHRTEQDYYNMQRESDTLCREYGLSVIEEPKRGKSKQYGEWNAERQGHSTWRGLVKSDVDTASRGAMTERQFWDNLKKQGYEIKMGKDISVRPPGKERYVRLFRNFGEDYTIESIRKRILEQSQPDRTTVAAPTPAKRVRSTGKLNSVKKTTGLRALYFYYLYRLGALPKKRKSNPKRVYFLLREDIRHMQNISREARLLAVNNIDTDVQLATHKGALQGDVNALYTRRKQLRKQLKSVTDEGKATVMKADVSKLSEQIGALRREVRLCEDIEKRSAGLPEKLRRAHDAEKSNEKELNKHEPFRRRR